MGVPSSTWTPAQWTASLDGRAFAMIAARLAMSRLAPSSAFAVRVMIDRVREPADRRGAAWKAVASMLVRTDANGAVAIY